MSKVLTSTKIALNTRKRILQCYIWSTLQYGVETWTITGSMAKRLSAFENVVLSENAENIVDREGFKRRSFRKSQNQEKIIQHHTNKKTTIFWAHHPPEWRHTAPHSFGW